MIDALCRFPYHWIFSLIQVTISLEKKFPIWCFLSSSFLSTSRILSSCFFLLPVILWDRIISCYKSWVSFKILNFVCLDGVPICWILRKIIWVLVHSFFLLWFRFFWVMLWEDDMGSSSYLLFSMILISSFDFSGKFCRRWYGFFFKASFFHNFDFKFEFFWVTLQKMISFF